MMKKPGEMTKDYNPDDIADLLELRQRIESWSKEKGDILKNERAEIPKEINNRVKDNWRPLLNIASVISNEWYNNTSEIAILNTST
jgi:hypothetical protein